MIIKNIAAGFAVAAIYLVLHGFKRTATVIGIICAAIFFIIPR